MMIGTRLYRCSRCGETKPKTTEHFYVARTGRVTGYCRPCHKAWWAAYYAARGEYARTRARRSSREYQRRRNGTPPERSRVGRPEEFAS